MRNDPHRLMVIQACHEHFSKRLRKIPVSQAARILEGLSYGDKSFWWVYRDSNHRLWTPNKLAKSGLRHWPAWSINPIKFMGGPPVGSRLQRGTLFTLLLDRIMMQVADEGLQGLDGIVEVDEVYA